MSLQFDPEFLQAIQPYLDDFAAAKKPAIHDIEAQRDRYALETALVNELAAEDSGVGVVEHQIETVGGQISVFEFRKDSKTNDTISPSAAIFHVHGGGMIMGRVKDNERRLKTLAVETGLPIFSVDYRVAPEHPHPIPVEDCYAGLAWLSKHSSRLNIDPKRIAILGESAGGGLAACTAILARDRQLNPPLAKQVLIFPMLDDRNTQPNAELERFCSWTAVDNATGWTALLGHDVVGGKDVSPYAAAARVESVEGLPPLYLDVGGLDIFCHENVSYVARFVAANIEPEIHVYPGVPHGFEDIAPDIGVAKRAKANRLRALMSI